MDDRYDDTDQYVREWERLSDEYLLQREHEAEERREKLLRGEPYLGDPDLYRDIWRGK